MYTTEVMRNSTNVPGHNVINCVQEQENINKETTTVMTNQSYIKYREMLQKRKVAKFGNVTMLTS